MMAKHPDSRDNSRTSPHAAQDCDQASERESYADMLKRNHLSLTAVRLTVLRVLDAHPHIDAERIFTLVKEQITTTSKQAIYNNLTILVGCNIIREIKPKGGLSLYETRTGDNHHHIVCRHCRAVMDTDCLSTAPCLNAIDDGGFNIDEAEITFWGVCPSCLNNPQHKGETA